MSPVLRANATLTQITAPSGPSGQPDDWDRQAAAQGGTTPGVKWTGRVAAYYAEKVTRTTGPDADNVTAYRLHVATAELPAALDADDLIAFDVDGETRTARVLLLARSRAPVSSPLATTRLDLQLDA